ncbi:hypothetical protein P7K49_006317 [Saguinus oedipus]|uniref:Uncharacterized protein n=1 Tax=Saguinus oedipus TaxID=9490 RepID=A0ABQ9W228_SAGOE|nr:hypothetical protein P7K49_006317 [Saguinus oedipus]
MAIFQREKKKDNVEVLLKPSILKLAEYQPTYTIACVPGIGKWEPVFVAIGVHSCAESSDTVLNMLDILTVEIDRLLCGGGESFLCASGICIPRKLQCNGYNDCDDWSDEAHCSM